MYGWTVGVEPRWKATVVTVNGRLKIRLRGVGSSMGVEWPEGEGWADTGGVPGCGWRDRLIWEGGTGMDEAGVRPMLPLSVRVRLGRTTVVEEDHDKGYCVERQGQGCR